MTRFLSLSSGSNGNCYYIGNDKCGILIDVGIGGRTIKKRLAEAGISIADIDLILVSHDHFDHIKSLGTFTERFGIPVYTTREIIISFEDHFCTRGYMNGHCHALRPEERAELAMRDGKISVTPFRVPHDASDNVGYHIDFFGETFTFMTDIGSVTDAAVHYAALADHLIVESNYDYDMLINGPYEEELKLRIRDGHGHLSNDQTAELLQRALSEADLSRVNPKDVFLCHLSENNNTPALALRSARKALIEKTACLGIDCGKIRLEALPRREASQIFTWG